MEVMMSRIEQLVSEIEEYIDGCKIYRFSSNKIIVDKEIMDDYLGELRRKLPSEIQKYKKLMDNKDAIINDANEQAQQIITKAQVYTEELVNQHEIMQKAYEQANITLQEASDKARDILDRATLEANEIRNGAMSYTDQMLSNLQQIVAQSLDENRKAATTLLKGLEEDLNIIVNNRNELRQESDAGQEASEEAQG
jgi:vacuolar-type H+-ATPase subunit H